MKIWSGVSRLLWREEPVHAVEPESLSPSRASGVPVYLRQAVRFTLTGFAAIVLTSQIVGIRLAAPVDANQSYGSCSDTCQRQFVSDVKACASSAHDDDSHAGDRSRGDDDGRDGDDKSRDKDDDSRNRSCVAAAQKRRDACNARCGCDGH